MSSLFPLELKTDEAILATLAFFKPLGLPLTLEQIQDNLLFLEKSPEEIKRALTQCELITEKDGLYSIKGDEFFYLEFEKKQANLREFWKKTHRYAWLFSICPFVELVSVCNSMSFGDAQENSDIDLLVICKKNHLFTARFFLTFLTQLFGVRRHGNKIAKRFCLSFYLSEEAMNFESILLKPYDIYFAYWLKRLEPLRGNFQSYKQMLEENSSWTRLYFQEITVQNTHFKENSKWQNWIKNLLEKWFSKKDWEHRFKRWQMRSILKKQAALANPSGTVVNDFMLKFHDHDAREAVRAQWERDLSNLL